MIQTGLSEAQQFLTTHSGDMEKRIVDLESLSERHSADEVIEFLKSYIKDKEHALRNMILIDKSHRKVDELVSSMFRLHMAIKILEDGRIIEIEGSEKEVNQIVQLKRGAAKSGKLRKGNRRGHISTRSGKDKNHDGKDRDTGQDVRCAA